MSWKTLALPLSLLALSSGEARPHPLPSPVWAPASGLKTEEDRRIANGLLTSLCPGPQCPGERSLEAMHVPVRRGRGLLVIRMPSGGTCGAFEMAVHGPSRHELLRLCGETLGIERTSGPMPDIVTTAFADRTGPRGPALETTTWNWTGKTYRAIRRTRAHARTTP